MYRPIAQQRRRPGTAPPSAAILRRRHAQVLSRCCPAPGQSPVLLLPSPSMPPLLHRRVLRRIQAQLLLPKFSLLDSSPPRSVTTKRAPPRLRQSKKVLQCGLKRFSKVEETPRSPRRGGRIPARFASVGQRRALAPPLDPPRSLLLWDGAVPAAPPQTPSQPRPDPPARGPLSRRRGRAAPPRRSRACRRRRPGAASGSCSARTPRCTSRCRPGR